MHRLSLLFLILTVACSSQSGKERATFEEKEVKGATLLIPSEASDEVRAPSEIQAVPGGFLVYDYGAEKIFKLDPDGNILLSFGSSGRGPGEFQEVFGLWELEEEYRVYDHSSAKFVAYDHEGNWLRDLPVTFDGFPSSPTRVEVINPHRFVIASGGRDGSLLTLVHVETQGVQHVGNAVGEYVPETTPVQMQQAISEGRIPAEYRNAVMLSSNQTGIFSFQQTTALLEKYTHSGELVWRKSVKVPAVRDLFEHLFRENRRRISSGKFLLSFNYGRRMTANGDGVAVLLNTPEDQPLTVAWVPNDGQNITVVTFPDIENRRLGLTFTISVDGSYIFFVDAIDGELYRAEWPL